MGRHRCCRRSRRARSHRVHAELQPLAGPGLGMDECQPALLFGGKQRCRGQAKDARFTDTKAMIRFAAGIRVGRA